MSKKREAGVWVIVCDFADNETGKPCDLGYDGAPAMFVDPDGGKTPEMHFQCGKHHGVVKQSEKKEYQLPEGVTPVEPKYQHTAEDIGVTLDTFKPDPCGQVWDGSKVDVKENPNGRRI